MFCWLNVFFYLKLWQIWKFMINNERIKSKVLRAYMWIQSHFISFTSEWSSPWSDLCVRLFSGVTSHFNVLKWVWVYCSLYVNTRKVCTNWHCCCNNWGLWMFSAKWKCIVGNLRFTRFLKSFVYCILEYEIQYMNFYINLCESIALF